jgi:hypothetical protein
MAVRHAGIQALAALPASVRAHHVGLGPSLVDEDQPGRIKAALEALPARATPGDVGARLFRRQNTFF